MSKIIIVGAGQLGSRHLQALVKVNSPLDITVIDPSQNSLKIAEQRFNEAGGNSSRHKIQYSNTFEDIPSSADLAVVATSAKVRLAALKNLLKHCKLKYSILEKILFSRSEDYSTASELLKTNGVKAWVNCSRRIIPFYRDLKASLGSGPISYHVTGSQYGLASSLIHFIDHMAYLIGSSQYRLNTESLDRTLLPSKRSDYFELTGTATVSFNDGSVGCLTSFANGFLPLTINISSESARFMIRQTEEKAWTSQKITNWEWQEVPAHIPPQSQMTTVLVEEILATGQCELLPYEESSILHLTMVNSLMAFINGGEKRFDELPFT